MVYGERPRSLVVYKGITYTKHRGPLLYKTCGQPVVFESVTYTYVYLLGRKLDRRARCWERCNSLDRLVAPLEDTPPARQPQLPADSCGESLVGCYIYHKVPCVFDLRIYRDSGQGWMRFDVAEAVLEEELRPSRGASTGHVDRSENNIYDRRASAASPPPCQALSGVLLRRNI